MRISTVRTAILVLIPVLFAASPSSPAELPSGGPRSLLITYRSEPANRPAFRIWLQTEGNARLDGLRREGVLASYQILFNPYVSSGTWDAMAVLTFSHYSDTQRWKDIERKEPGGLTPKALALAKPVDTFSADLQWSGESESASKPRDGVYYVIPYEYSSADQYRKYVDGYVIPQVKGWMQTGVLAGYRIFMNRFGVGRPWDALFIYQYRDLEAFGRRDEIVAQVRKSLANDAEWQHLSDIKQTIRTESENTVAESLAP